MTSSQRPAAGWYVDPEGDLSRLRYWDGAQWTEHFSSIAPVPPPAGSVVSVNDGTIERVKAAIPNVTLESGFMGVKSRRYTLILTGRRVIFARSTTITAMKRRVASARDSVKSEDEGLLLQMASQMDGYLEWATSYFDTPPDKALAETAGNFAIERSEITKTSFKTRRLRPEGNTVVGTDEQLVIKAHGKKYVVRLGLGKHQAKQALNIAGMN